MEFKEVYANLNIAQKEAVDTIEGPLLVIAGPGTGKTQLLSARVANILNKTDSGPENILCLTFTDKAANNMRRRLLEMIGPSARKVVVKTFHGLGAEIMNSNPEYFWNAARLEAAPEAVKLELVSNILSKLPLKNPLALKFSGQYTLVDDVLRAIVKAKEAGLTPAKLRAITSANLTYIDSLPAKLYRLVNDRLSKKQLPEYTKLLEELPDEMHDELTAPIPSLAKIFKESLEIALAESEANTTPLSKWKRDWFETVLGQKVFRDVRRNSWWYELATVYELYQKQMHKNRYFDFADMILGVITQLEQNETLRADLQERFNYILVDEFQDTNDAQFRLSYLIANSPVSEQQPNIMAVGDDDQAIYRFQGAEISNASQFMDSYKDTKLIVLTDNYRSHQTVLDVAEQVATQIDYRLINNFEGLNKHIEARSTTKPGSIEHQQFLSQTQQYHNLASHIMKARSKNDSRVVVLARTHSSLEHMAAQLSQLSVPIRYERSSNILDHPVVTLVTQVTGLLEAVHQGNQALANALIADILPHPAWEIDPVTLWRVALAQSKARTNWLESLLAHEDKTLVQFASWVLNLAKTARALPLQITIEHVLGLRSLDGYTSPIKNYYTSQNLSSDYLFSLTALQRLRTLASEYAKNETVGLTQFVNYLSINREHHVVLANEAAFVTGDNPVELMTVHKAKGLEFDSVYVIDVTEKQWQPSRRNRTPPTNLESLQSYGEESDDYARLLFVALTRAKQTVIVSSYKYDDHGQEVLPSSLIHHLPKVEIAPSTAVTEIAEATLSWPELKGEQRHDLLRDLFANYQLSATGLIDFLDITKGGPNYFINRHILRLPEVRPASLSFGSAVHSALETAQRLANGSGLDLMAVIESFKTALLNEHLDIGEFERYSEHGELLLTKLLNEKLLTFQAGDYPERTIFDIPIGSALIKGTLDLVQPRANSLTIVDYKTGQALRSLTSTTQADGIRAWKHRLQLTYYALLARESGLAKPDQVISAEMVYVEAEDPAQMRQQFTPSTEDLQHLTHLIQAVSQHLKAVDLPTSDTYEPSLAGIKAFESDLLKTYNKE